MPGPGRGPSKCHRSYLHRPASLGPVDFRVQTSALKRGTTHCGVGPWTYFHRHRCSDRGWRLLPAPQDLPKASARKVGSLGRALPSTPCPGMEAQERRTVVQGSPLGGGGHGEESRLAAFAVGGLRQTPIPSGKAIINLTVCAETRRTPAPAPSLPARVRGWATSSHPFLPRGAPSPCGASGYCSPRGFPSQPL